jgi:hypothetical protein
MSRRKSNSNCKSLHTFLTVGDSEEDKFRDEEANLRATDLELQNSMIKFSHFLQENEKKKAEADKKQSDEKNVSSSVLLIKLIVENRDIE